MARRSLAGARTLVTGASSGIGRAIALELARQGARLLVTARRTERLQELVDEIGALSGEATFVAGDIADPGFRAQLVDVVRERFGSLDVLVNNAGIGAFGRFDQADEARLRRLMEVNFFAPVELTRLLLPLMRAGQRPIVVNVGSVLGHFAVPLKSEYCASKFALHGFSDALRCELVRDGIDVLLVSPSTTTSEFFDNVVDSQEKPNAPVTKAMSPAMVAKKTVRAIEQGRNEIILSVGGKLLVWFDRLFPTAANWVMAKFGQK